MSDEDPRWRSAFPLAAKYDPRWVYDNALGENTLCQMEALARRLPFRPGTRVLDLGCGKAISSIFLAREFNLEVWATDGAVSPTENRRRAIDLGCAERVFPLRADARALPFAEAFFDSIVAIDSFLYFGTDDRYLAYLAQFLKPDGFIGIVDLAFTREIESIADAPGYLRAEYSKHWSFVHTLAWWKQHWEKAGVVDIRSAEILPESGELLRDYLTNPRLEQDPIMRAVQHDREGLIALFCLVAQKHSSQREAEQPRTT